MAWFADAVNWNFALICGTSNRIAYLNETAKKIENIPFGNVDKEDILGSVNYI